MLAVFQKVSAGILAIEKALLIFLAAAVTGLILLNVVTRSVDYALYWVDELAIYAMIWMVMIGASMIVRLRKGIAVTILDEVLPTNIKAVLALIVDFMVLAFSATLIWLSYIWYDPLTLIAVDFDLAAFSADSFNFIYEEPTNTLGIPKFWIWLIIPIVAITMTWHAFTNFAERLLKVPSAAPEVI
ncbi:MAG: TRAP transporter small permease subunit [Sneathiella sp.]|nr:TRAP transporter small permease subunit [Sneathiella sp.]